MAGDQDLALPWTDIEGPCRWCGKVLARAPARTAARWCSPGYVGKGDAFEDAIADISIASAARLANERGPRDPQWHIGGFASQEGDANCMAASVE